MMVNVTCAIFRSKHDVCNFSAELPFLLLTIPRILAWKIPWTKEPGEPQSMGLRTVRQNWATEHVRSRIKHYWQNGGMVPSPLSSFRRRRSRDEGVRPCNSDLSFPLLGWVDWKGILRCLLFLRGAWEGTKPSAVVFRK